MAEPRRTYLDMMGVSPDLQAEIHDFIDWRGDSYLAHSMQLIINPILAKASLVSLVAFFISDVAHRLGYLSDSYASVLVFLLGLPLFYLYILATFFLTLFVVVRPYLNTMKEDARRNRQ